jgi:hypothetical protein
VQRRGVMSLGSGRLSQRPDVQQQTFCFREGREQGVHWPRVAASSFMASTTGRSAAMRGISLATDKRIVRLRHPTLP